MADLLDFRRGQIVFAYMVDASVTKTAQMFGFSTGKVSKITNCLWKKRKHYLQSTSLVEIKVVWERDRRSLHRIVRKDRRTMTLKITSNLNEHLQNTVSTKTVCREFHKGTFQGRLAIWKPLFLQTNVSKRLEWYMAHLISPLSSGKEWFSLKNRRFPYFL